jgi:flagellar basal-body rod modification protein FlgD
VSQTFLEAEKDHGMTLPTAAIPTETRSAPAKAAPASSGGRTPVSTTPGAFAGASETNADFETFLKMLTTQMRNQDPLNPMESSDFAVQLATFSGVEQQVLTNQLLSGLAEQAGAGRGLADYAGWIGMEARSGAPVAFDGEPVELVLSPDPAADRGLLVVRDEAGRVLQESPLAPGTERVIWEGAASPTEALPNGVYEISARWLSGSEVLGETPAESYASVAEVRVDPAGQVELLLESGFTVAASRVTAVRNGQAG